MYTHMYTHKIYGRFPWLQKLEENAAVVQQELKEALQMGEMLEKSGAWRCT